MSTIDCTDLKRIFSRQTKHARITQPNLYVRFYFPIRLPRFLQFFGGFNSQGNFSTFSLSPRICACRSILPAESHITVKYVQRSRRRWTDCQGLVRLDSGQGYGFESDEDGERKGMRRVRRYVTPRGRKKNARRTIEI